MYTNTVLKIMPGNWPFARYVASLCRQNCITCNCLKNDLEVRLIIIHDLVGYLYISSHSCVQCRFKSFLRQNS